MGSKILEYLAPFVTLPSSPKRFTFNLPFKKAEPNKYDLDFTTVDILGCLLGLPVCLWYILTNHWSASNILGAAFSLQGIELISLGKFFNGFILLSGLFIYDIFWVFGTDVMVSVAKNFDAPIKLLFPQMDGTSRPSMLGLGDIVIPGVFIALLLRFDLRTRRGAPLPSLAQAPYFAVNLVAYFFGLSLTVGIMYFFKAAQPALLYLVPACLGAALLTASRRGEFTELWTYSEEKEEDKKEEGEGNGDESNKEKEDGEGDDPKKEVGNNEEEDESVADTGAEHEEPSKKPEPAFVMRGSSKKIN